MEEMKLQVKELLNNSIYDDDKHFYMSTPTGSVSTGEGLMCEACERAEDEYDLYCQGLESYEKTKPFDVWLNGWVDEILSLDVEVKQLLDQEGNPCLDEFGEEEWEEVE